MITKNECADYINANINNLLTIEEINTLRDSIEQHPSKDTLIESLIHLVGDVSLLVDIRDKA